MIKEKAEGQSMATGVVDSTDAVAKSQHTQIKDESVENMKTSAAAPKIRILSDSSDNVFISDNAIDMVRAINVDRKMATKPVNTDEASFLSPNQIYAVERRLSAFLRDQRRQEDANSIPGSRTSFARLQRQKRYSTPNINYDNNSTEAISDRLFKLRLSLPNGTTKSFSTSSYSQRAQC